MQRKLSVEKALIHWVVAFWGDLAGRLFLVVIITGFGGVFDSAAYKHEAIVFATTKQITPGWHMVLQPGIGAN